jgi:2',3'-cyclic-nucleotide 2'-phosphodiesterase (5'-nucleotidase family)
VLANLRLPDASPLPGAQPAALPDLGDLRPGLIGVTSETWGTYETRFGPRALPALPLIEELIAALRQDCADAVILLSHRGLHTDRGLAAALTGIPLILGAHSHTCRPRESLSPMLSSRRRAGTQSTRAGWTCCATENG